MFLVFIDESGNTGFNLRDPDQPYHHIGGVIVRYDRCIELQDAIEGIAIENCGTYSLPKDFEFKGSWLFSGKKFFSGMPPERRIEITELLLDLLDTFDLNYIISIIDKQALDNRYYTPFHPHNLACLFFLEMFQEHLASNDRLGLVIADEEQERSDDIILDFKKYKRQGTGFCAYRSVDLTRIIDNIHFVKSHDSWPLQLSDVVLYHYNRGRVLWRRGEGNGYSQAEQKLLELYEKILPRGVRLKVFP